MSKALLKSSKQLTTFSPESRVLTVFYQQIVLEQVLKVYFFNINYYPKLPISYPTNELSKVNPVKFKCYSAEIETLAELLVYYISVTDKSKPFCIGGSINFRDFLAMNIILVST